MVSFRLAETSCGCQGYGRKSHMINAIIVTLLLGNLFHTWQQVRSRERENIDSVA